MADFLNHLLMRSITDVSTAAVLQPRLPSLFEPMRGPVETPLPSPDYPIGEGALPDHQPASAEGLQHKWEISHADEVTDPRPSLISEPDRREIPSKQVKAEYGAGQGPRLEIQSARHMPVSESTHPVTLSSQIQKPVEEVRPFDEQDHFLNGEHADQATEHEVLAEQAHEPDKNCPQIKMIRNSVEIHLKTVEDVSRDQKTDPAGKTAVPPSRGSKPMPPIRTTPIPSLSATPQAMDPQGERPQIVEVHIGRIEVRATPTPSVKRPSQKTTTMSLEEYLRSRPGEKR